MQVKYQEVKVQELAEQVPKGQVPRHITVSAVRNVLENNVRTPDTGAAEPQLK